MSTLIRLALLRALFVGLLLMLTMRTSWAQAGPAAPHGYDFMTVTVQESPFKKEPHIQFAPAFQEQTIIPLPNADVYATSAEALAKTGECLSIANQQLSAITTAGWELFQMNVINSLGGRITTRYLFRKAKN